ncbi:transient receptor potential cation channel subfamily M member 3, partial [Nephila pilipes]
LREKNGPQQALPVYAWNSVSVNPAGIGLDRQSWITSSDGSALVYKLDSEGVPQYVFTFIIDNIHDLIFC